MRIICIGGEPATGKTSLVSEIIKNRSHGITPVRKKLKSCKFTIYDKSRLIVLGVYDNNQPFNGTDRLSTAVQSDAKRLIKILLKDEYYADFTILFEGDRLFNNGFIKWLKSVHDNCTFLLLLVKDDNLKQRHINRRDTQTESWLKGRKTKINNIRRSHEDILLMHNNNYEQQQINLKILLDAIP